MAYIKQTNGTTKSIRNLGWLLRNWRGIESLEWTDAIPHCNSWDGTFRAYMTDGRVYVTNYASFTVWKSFINRPVFRGLVCTVNGIQGKV